MENEAQTPKKKSGALFTVFACIMTGVIVFFATTIGQELSKSNDSGSKKSNNSNSTESNSNSNTNTVSKLSDEEALTTGKDLYNKAASLYDYAMSGEKYCTETSEGYDCTNLYNEMKKVYANKHSFATMKSTEYKNLFDKFTEKDGKYYFEIGGIGINFKCTTTLAVKSVEADKIVLTATTEEVDYDKKTSTFTNDFEIVKEDGTWKASKFNYIFGNTVKVKR